MSRKRLGLLPVVLGIWLGADARAAVPTETSGKASASAAARLKIGVSPGAFNPSLGQRVQIAVDVSRSGTLSATILDRDGFPVRTLAADRAVPAGAVSIPWDGRDERGQVVPDEAYFVRLRLFDERKRSVAALDPLASAGRSSESPADVTYSSADGILTYTLARAGRVHVEAGQAPVDPTTKQRTGPVLKVIVDRAPRPTGKILERWDGWDESRTIFVPDLADMVFSVVAIPFPDGAIIATGNRERSFVDYARQRPPRKRPGLEGSPVLSALQDRGPRLTLTALAPYDAAAKRYVAAGDLTVTLALDPAEAAHFVSQPTKVQLFLDHERILTAARPKNPSRFVIDSAKLPPGEHRLAANWFSSLGPATVNAFRLYVPEKTQKASK